MQMYIFMTLSIKYLFSFQYYEMSYGLNIEMHKQVGAIMLLIFSAQWFSTASGDVRHRRSHS